MQNVKLPSEKMVSLTQHRLTFALKCTVITLSVIALYFQDLSMVFSGAISDESTFHILAIPFLLLYLLYRKRKMVNASLTSQQKTGSLFQRNFNVIAGTMLCVVAMLVYWYGSYSFTPLEFHMFTLPFMAAGLILILFNFQTLRELIFPVAFLTFLAPPPSEVLYSVGSWLANLSAVASNGLVNVFGIPATLSSSNTGPVITVVRPGGILLPFNVSVACSGIYSIIGFLIFALFIAYITVGRMRNKLFILVMGIPLIILLNIIRISAILGIGYNWGEDLALQVFHTVGATVLMFIGTLILLAVSEKAFKKPPAATPCLSCTPTPKNPVQEICSKCGKLLKAPLVKLNMYDITKILTIGIATILLLSIQAPVFALTEGPAQVISTSTSGIQVNKSAAMFPVVAGYNLSYSYRDTSYEAVSGNDAALVYMYTPTTGSGSTVWVAMQIGSSSTSQHRWETCLINYPLSQGDQSTVVQLDLHDVQLQDNPPMTGRYFAFQYKASNQTQVVLYWYQTATFNTNGTAQTKSVMISLVMYPSSAKDVASCEATELPIAQAINSYWQPIKTWSVVSLAISKNGLMLSAGAIAALVSLVIYEIYMSWREKLSLLTLYRKLPTQDQLLIKAIENSGYQNSTAAITSEYQKIINVDVSEAFVEQKLHDAEKTGLVKKSLCSNRDNPVLVWQTQLPKHNGGFFRWLPH